MGDHSSVEVDAVVRKYVKLAGAEKGGLQFMLLGKKSLSYCVAPINLFLLYNPFKGKRGKDKFAGKTLCKTILAG